MNSKAAKKNKNIKYPWEKATGQLKCLSFKAHNFLMLKEEN